MHATLPSVTPLRNDGKICCSVARIVAKNRTDFYFSQRLRQQKSCETCSFQGMLHWAIFPATCIATTCLAILLRYKFQAMLHRAIFPVTCIATKLRDMLRKRLLSVTAPLEGNSKNIVDKMVFRCCYVLSVLSVLSRLVHVFLFTDATGSSRS